MVLLGKLFWKVNEIIGYETIGQNIFKIVSPGLKLKRKAVKPKTTKI